MPRTGTLLGVRAGTSIRAAACLGVCLLACSVDDKGLTEGMKLTHADGSLDTFVSPLGGGGSSFGGVAGQDVGTGGAAGGDGVTGLAGERGSGGVTAAGDGGSPNAGTAGATGGGGPTGAAADGGTGQGGALGTGVGGQLGSGGVLGSGGGSGGRFGAGGGLGTGGSLGAGGVFGAGGVLGAGGTFGTGGRFGLGGAVGAGGRGGAVGFCNPSTCADGCCASGRCVHATSAQQCGARGAACVACGPCDLCESSGQCAIDPASQWKIVADSAQATMDAPGGGTWDPMHGDEGGSAPDLFCEFEDPAGEITSETAGVTTTVVDTFFATWNQIITPVGLTVSAAKLMAPKPTWLIWVGDEDCANPGSCGTVGEAVCAYSQPVPMGALESGQLTLANYQSCAALRLSFLCQAPTTAAP